MVNIRSSVITLWLACCLCGCCIGKLAQTNLLYIMYDDLRPELSIYGRPHMITPNFERLARRSVVFDYAFAQVAVCNPSRDSIMTGLRPDTLQSYNFQSSYSPNIPFPTQLVRSGYNTAAYGKILHWERENRGVWNYDSWNNGWYDYQSFERSLMNSSTMPDKYRPEEAFRDHMFTDRALATLKELIKKNKPFALAVGFKLPHLAVHVPYKYYDMYKGKSSAWKLTKKELRFPLSSPSVSYRCCAEGWFSPMEQEGSVKSKKTIIIGDINMPFTEEMHDELMIGYNAAITFLDKQLGRLLDALDEYKLWDSITVVLTADHGMHNGEKGIWEKWTVFDEATRVPLMIAHPLSPFKGQHYTYPVELIDIYPTLNDLLSAPYNKAKACLIGTRCLPLQGKSLAPVILGDKLFRKHFNFDEIIDKASGNITVISDSINVFSKRSNKTNLYHLFPPIIASKNSTLDFDNTSAHRNLRKKSNSALKEENIMPTLSQTIAISQHIRCATNADVNQWDKPSMNLNNKTMGSSSSSISHQRPKRKQIWIDCNMRVLPSQGGTGTPNEVCVMGYSMRSLEYRYTGYFHHDRGTRRTDFERAPFIEELYDHKNETLADFTHRELINLATKNSYAAVVKNQREKLIAFLKERIVPKPAFVRNMGMKVSVKTRLRRKEAT